MPEIVLKNLKKTFNEGRIVAVNEVNLTLNDRDYIFILGPSGCGKTTLLKMISGLHTPTSGNIYIDGKDVTNDPPQKRGIAFIFQAFEIFPMTVWENTIYSLKVRGFPEKYMIEEGERALKLAGLETRADVIPIGWSNGDLQRIGLARAICSGAKILIMDEPLGSLDPKVNRRFRWELRRIIKESGLTAIQVTHDQDEAMVVADRIIVMRDGNLLQEDYQEKLYKKPKSLFVGNFLGGFNILEGYIYHMEYPDIYEVKVRLGGPKYRLRANDHKYDLDENVVIAFRSEDLYLFPLDYDYDSSQADWTGIEITDGKCIDRFLTGKEIMYVVELDNGDTIKAKKPHVFQYDFEVGEKLKIGLFTDDLLLYKYPANLQNEMALQ